MPEKLNFTKPVLQQLLPPDSGKRAAYIDTKVPVLQLRVTGNGVKTFVVYRRVKGGNPSRVTLGRFPAMTIERARTEASRINLEIEGGSNPTAIKRAFRAEQTFAALFADYLERHAKPNKRTWRGDEAMYKRYLQATLGPKKLSSLDRAAVASVHSAITRDGHPTTANRALALVSGVFGWARSAGLWEANPSLGIRKNAERSRDRFLQPFEVPRFFASLAEEPNETVRDYILLSLLTGARRANVLALKWAEIDFDRAEWRIPRTKNNDPQTIPLTAEALAVIRPRATNSQSPYVFPGHGTKGHLVEPKLGWRRIFDRDELRQISGLIQKSGGKFYRGESEGLVESVRRARHEAKKLDIDISSARMKDLRIHDLRRTLGSWQARTGASLSIIGKSLNHKSVQTTAIYSRLDTDPVRESVERATAAILIAAGVRQSADVTAAKSALRRQK